MATLEILIPKANAPVAVDMDVILDESYPQEAWNEILRQGLKHFLTQGMGDIKTTGLSGKELEKAQAVALEKAQANLDKVLKGQIRITGGKAKAKAGNKAVVTEAMRIARAMVRDAIKSAGQVKISHVPAKEITELARQLLSGDYGPEIIASAEKNIAEREGKEAEVRSGLAALVGEVKADPKLVAKAEAKAEAAKKPVARAKPKPEAHQQAH